MVEDRPLGSWKSLFKGFLGGSLIGSGIFSMEFGVGVQAIIFIIGLIIITDTMISKTEEIYPLTMLLGALIGFFIVILSAASKANLYCTVLIFILAVLVYLGRLAKRMKRR